MYDKNCTGVIAYGTNVEIGSGSPEDRNIFFSKCSVAQSAGIAVVNGSTTIFGNYIGMAKDGVTDLTPEAADANGLTASFSLGLSLLNTLGTSSRLGGPDEGQTNLITGNSVGVAISGNQNTIQGNLIGTKYNGEVNKTITNGLGITSTLGTDSLIGGTESGEGNLIAGVKGSGVEFASLRAEQQDSDFVPEKVSVLGNSIYDITPYNLLGVGETNLGLDLAAWTDTDGDFVPDQFTNRGVTPNDTSDPDTGPNNYVNFPVLKTAQQSGNQLTITYDLDAADSPTDRYRVEFFANNERSIFGYGPGETYLGAATSVAPGEDKTVTLTVNGDFAGKALSATTTAIDATTDSGFGSTSEFAQNISVGSSADFDADGIADAIEAAAPNNGDGNNDGIDDKDQPTVSSFKDYDGTNYLTLITEGCSENGTVSSLNASSLQVKDNGYIYPHGLTNFTLYCSRGDTVNVTLYIHDDTSDPQKYIPRKFNPNTSKFYDVPGSAVATETLGASTAVKLTYSLKDGGDLDDDGEENGVIVDPIGLATEQTGILANTGSLIVLAIPFGIVILVAAVVTYRDYRKHKKPLIDADPVAASSYTYWHHLKVVTVPVAAYRIRFTFERKQKFDVTPT